MFRIFSHSTPVHFSSWNCESGPKLRKSFIYHLCTICLGPWCPTSKTDLTLEFPECQTCQTCLMKEFEFERKPLCVLGILRSMNMETNWMFPTDISWPTHHAVGEVCSHLKLPGTDSLPLSGMLPTPQLFNTLHTFRHPCSVLNSCHWCFSDQLFNFQCFASFHIQLLSTSPPETARVARNCESHSFIICVQYALGLRVQHLKLIWHWNAKPAKPASWRNSNGNRFVCWAFCAPWTWKQTECFPLTFLGQHIMLLAKFAPISSYPALIRCRSVACFRRPNFSIHYIPSGIPVVCWTHATGVSVINFLIFNVSHLFTFNSCPLLLLKLREWPETAKVIHSSFVYSMPWAFVSNI